MLYRVILLLALLVLGCAAGSTIQPGEPAAIGAIFDRFAPDDGALVYEHSVHGPTAAPQPVPPLPAPPPPEPAPCLSCGGALPTMEGEMVCAAEERRRFDEVQACACTGACATACAGSSMCGGAEERPDCSACVAIFPSGCGAERWMCEHETDTRPQCLADGHCLWGQKCGAADTSLACIEQESDCSKVYCYQPSCIEPGRYSVTNRTTIDRLHGRRLWTRTHYGNLWALGDAEARDRCATLDAEAEGITGWRVPTLPELQSILLRPALMEPFNALLHCLPALDQASLPATSNAWYAVDMGVAPDGKPVPMRIVSITNGNDEPWWTWIAAKLVCIHDPLDAGAP